MKDYIRKLLQSKWCLFLVLLNICFYIASCFTPYIHPKYFFGFTFLALGFPLLFIGIVFWLLLFFITRHKRKWPLLIVLLPGYNNFRATVGLNFFTKNSTSVTKKSIKIISWNINEFGQTIAKYSDTFNSNRRKIIRFIKQEQPDIICFQDFSDRLFSSYDLENLSFVRDSLKYPYVFFKSDMGTVIKDTVVTPAGYIRYGTVIYSRFPIVNTGKINFGDDKFLREGISFCDITINNKPLRIFNTHLKSLQLSVDKKATYPIFDYQLQDSNLTFKASKFEKLKRYDTIHANQALLVRKVIDSTKIPFIFCGDLNSVPTSFVYHTISKGLKDAFTEKGKGLGTTYSAISPTLRIDVILTHPSLNVEWYNSPAVKMSDHYPVMATIRY